MGCRIQKEFLSSLLISFLPLLFISIRKETSLSLSLSLSLSALYLRRVSTTLMVSMRSDARVPVPRSTYVCTHVRGAIPHARACSGAHARTHDLRDSDGKGMVGGGGSGARGLHGRELCLARDVKLLAIS